MAYPPGFSLHDDLPMISPDFGPSDYGGMFAVPDTATSGVLTIDWQKCLGGSADDYGESISLTPDGGHVITGLTHSDDGDVSGNHGGYEDLWVAKLASDGSVSWQKCLGGSGNELGASISLTSDGGYIVVGSTNSTNFDVSGNHGGFDVWVVKLASNGNVSWQQCLGGSGNDFGQVISQGSDGEYIVTGYTKSTDCDVSGNHGGDDLWVVKLASNGSVLWQQCIGGESDDYGESISLTSDGGYIITGYTDSTTDDFSGNHGGIDMWVVKLTSDGSVSWQQCLGGSSIDVGASISLTSDGGYIISGSTYSDDGDVSENHGACDIWVVKLTSDGSVSWQHCLGGSGDDFGLGISPVSEGGYFVTGYTYSNDGDVSGNHGMCDIWVVTLASDGGILWEQCLGGSEYDIGCSISLGSGGGYVLIGTTDSDDFDVSVNRGLYDMWVVQIDVAPIADFTATFTVGTAPMAVQFNDASMYSPTSWNWSFGDGNISSEQNPSNTYPEVGIYNVSLTVSNAVGDDSMIKTGYISVVDPFEIPLTVGWNLISIPVTNANLTVPSDVTGVVYMYDSIGNVYAAVDISAIEPCKGYWVAAVGNCTIVARGNGKECYAADMTQGWNLIGSVCTNTSFTNLSTIPEGAVQGHACAYDPITQNYVLTTILTPCSGYWVSATTDCILNVNINTSG